MNTMTVKECAEYLGICLDSVYKLTQAGKMPCHKIGNRTIIIQEEVDEWLSQIGNLDIPRKVRKARLEDLAVSA